MNKDDLITAMAKKTGLTKTTATRLLDAFIDTVQDTVAEGDPVRLTGFGTFKSVKVAARTGRNPITTQKMTLPATTRPHFTPGAFFKKKVKD